MGLLGKCLLMALQIMIRTKRGTSHVLSNNYSGIEILANIRKQYRLQILKKIINGKSTDYLFFKQNYQMQ